MARKAEPGISYYRVNCNHVHNKKIKLLFNEFGSDGYWVWHCILSTAYGSAGYYFDCNDRDSLELFSLDVCKMRVTKVDEIIAGCLRRSLFDERVFKMFGVLTSVMMQEDYVTATYERRKKTSVIELKKEYLLIDILPTDKNIVINHGNNSITPVSNSINPVSSTQSRVEYSREDKSREEKEKKIPPRDEILENSILDFFGFNETANHDKARLVNEFCFCLKNHNRLDFFKNQFEAYKALKNDYGGFKHSFKNFLGDQKEIFENGAWNAENWFLRLKEEKEKSSAKKENPPYSQQQPVRGVEAALKFADVKMWEDDQQ